jgi:hypothetical protein
MISTLKSTQFKLIIGLAILFSLMALVAAPAVDAQSKAAVCEGVGAVTGSGCGGGSGSVNNVIATVINILSSIVGVVAVIMIIIAGYKYVTSSGDSSNVQSAKNTLIFAIVGIVVVAFAQLIVQFVLDRTT